MIQALIWGPAACVECARAGQSEERSSLSSHELLSQVVVVAAAAVVPTQAATMRRYVWMTLFLVVAGLFRPIFSVAFSNYVSRIASAFGVILFFFSLELLQSEPRLSIASITDCTRRSESL